MVFNRPRQEIIDHDYGLVEDPLPVHREGDQLQTTLDGLQKRPVIGLLNVDNLIGC